MYAQHMSKMIQVRNVPDGVHRTLKAQAALAGLSLSDFLLAEIRQLAERPTIAELRERLRRRARVAEPVSADRRRTPRTGCAVIVLDASAAVEWLFQSPAGVKIDRRIFSVSESLHAPHLLDVEVVQVLRRYVRDKMITAQRGQEAIEDLGDLPLNRYPHDFLTPRVWELRATLTAYDAAYVALAELLDAPLLTCDGKIASAPGHDANVEVV